MAIVLLRRHARLQGDGRFAQPFDNVLQLVPDRGDHRRVVIQFPPVNEDTQKSIGRQWRSSTGSNRLAHRGDMFLGRVLPFTTSYDVAELDEAGQQDALSTVWAS